MMDYCTINRDGAANASQIAICACPIAHTYVCQKQTEVMVNVDRKGGYVELDLGTMKLGGPMTIVIVGKMNALNVYSRLFDCGNGKRSDNILVSEPCWYREA